MSALSELSGSNKDTEVPSYFFSGLANGMLSGMSKLFGPARNSGGFLGRFVNSAENAGANLISPMLDYVDDGIYKARTQNLLDRQRYEREEQAIAEAVSSGQLGMAGLSQLFKNTSTVRDPVTGDVYQRGDRGGLDFRPDRSGYGSNALTGLDSLLRTAARPGRPILTRQVPYNYKDIENYQENDYYNYIRNNKAARKAFESSTGARNIAQKAWDPKKGAIDYSKFDKDAYRDAAVDYARNYYNKTGKGLGHVMPMMDKQRIIDKQKMLEEEYLGDRPDREKLVGNVQDAIFNRLYNKPTQRQYNPFSTNRFSNYTPRQSFYGQPSYGGFGGGGLGGLFGKRNRGFGQPSFGGFGGGDQGLGGLIRSVLGSGIRGLFGGMNGNRGRERGGLGGLFGGMNNGIQYGPSERKSFDPSATLTNQTDDFDYKGYADNFTADDLFGFNARDIRNSGRKRNEEGFSPFEISDEQLDNFWSSQSDDFRNAYNDYTGPRERTSIFDLDGDGEKNDSYGPDKFWDYDNNTLDKRSVMRQVLRNNLGNHQRNDNKLTMGLSF